MKDMKHYFPEPDRDCMNVMNWAKSSGSPEKPGALVVDGATEEDVDNGAVEGVSAVGGGADETGTAVGTEGGWGPNNAGVGEKEGTDGKSEDCC